MDLRYTASEQAFRDELRALAGRHAARRGRTAAPRRLAGPARLRPALAAPPVRRGLRRRRLAGRGRRAGLLAGGAADLQGGVRTGRRALRRGRTSSASCTPARPSSPRGRRRRRSATCPPSCAARRCGARASASPTPGATWPRCAPGPSATATTTWSPARRSGRRTPRWPTSASCWCAPGERAQPGHHLADHAHGHARHRDPAAAHHRGDHRVRRAVPQRGAGAGGQPGGRGERRLAGDHGHAVLRAGHRLRGRAPRVHAAARRAARAWPSGSGLRRRRRAGPRASAIWWPPSTRCGR